MIGEFFPSIPTLMRFKSHDEWMDYFLAQPERLSVVSPGHVASRLGVSRQRVYALLRTGKLRGWLIYDSEAGSCYDTSRHNTASYIYISSDDVERYRTSPKDKGGRPKKLLT